MTIPDSGEPSPIQQQLDIAADAHRANVDAFLVRMSMPLVGSPEYLHPDTIEQDKIMLDKKLPKVVVTESWRDGIVISNNPAFAAELSEKGAVTAAERRALLEAQRQEEIATTARRAHIPLSHVVRVRPS